MNKRILLALILIGSMTGCNIDVPATVGQLNAISSACSKNDGVKDVKFHNRWDQLTMTTVYCADGAMFEVKAE